MSYADRGTYAMINEVINPTVITTDGEITTGAATASDLDEGLKKITPSLILLAVVSGAALAVGTGAVNKYLWKK